MGTTSAVMGYNGSSPKELSRSLSQDMAVAAMPTRLARKFNQRPALGMSHIRSPITEIQLSFRPTNSFWRHVLTKDLGTMSQQLHLACSGALCPEKLEPLDSSHPGRTGVHQLVYLLPDAFSSHRNTEVIEHGSSACGGDKVKPLLD
jgi:hypothetical protein